MDSSYLKLTDGTRIKNWAGVQMEEGHQLRHGKNWLYIEIPILGVWDSETEKWVSEVKRNQHVFVRAACKVDVRGYHFIEVEPNAALAEYGSLQPSYRVHPDSGVQPVGMWLTARKDVDLSQLSYAVRIYMPA